MTNVSSGSKRTWEGVDNESYKKQREREEPKDWREVHLRSPARKTSASRRHSADRRGDGGRRRGGDSDYRRTNDNGRDRPRRDDRERGYRDEIRRLDSHTLPRHTNAQKKDDDEKEEGE